MPIFYSRTGPSAGVVTHSTGQTVGSLASPIHSQGNPISCSSNEQAPEPTATTSTSTTSTTMAAWALRLPRRIGPMAGPPPMLMRRAGPLLPVDPRLDDRPRLYGWRWAVSLPAEGVRVRTRRQQRPHPHTQRQWECGHPRCILQVGPELDNRTCLHSWRCAVSFPAEG